MTMQQWQEESQEAMERRLHAEDLHRECLGIGQGMFDGTWQQAEMPQGAGVSASGSHRYGAAFSRAPRWASRAVASPQAPP